MNDADSALREILRADIKDAIEAGPIVFPGTRRSKFHQLLVAELLPETGKQGFGHVGRRAGHLRGQPENVLLNFVEGVRVFKIAQRQ